MTYDALDSVEAPKLLLFDQVDFADELIDLVIEGPHSLVVIFCDKRASWNPYVHTRAVLQALNVRAKVTIVSKERFDELLVVRHISQEVEHM